jgi:hypothetical protein
VLFERLEKLSLPSMAVGEKQKVTWPAEAIITFRAVALIRKDERRTSSHENIWFS